LIFPQPRSNLRLQDFSPSSAAIAPRGAPHLPNMRPRHFNDISGPPSSPNHVYPLFAFLAAFFSSSHSPVPFFPFLVPFFFPLVPLSLRREPLEVALYDFLPPSPQLQSLFFAFALDPTLLLQRVVIPRVLLSPAVLEPSLSFPLEFLPLRFFIFAIGSGFTRPPPPIYPINQRLAFFFFPNPTPENVPSFLLFEFGHFFLALTQKTRNTLPLVLSVPIRKFRFFPTRKYFMWSSSLSFPFLLFPKAPPPGLSSVGGNLLVFTPSSV